MGIFDKFKKKDAEVEALIVDLSDADWQKRQTAAQQLGQLGSRASPAQSALEDAIADENVPLRPRPSPWAL